MNDILRKIEEQKVQENAERIVLAILVGAFIIGVIVGAIIDRYIM